MNKNELIAEVADECELTKAKAAEVVDVIFDAIAKSLASGDEVRLIGFGTFTVYQSKESWGRNPQTGAKMRIAASKRPKFRAGKGLKDLVNKARRKAA